MAVTIDYDKVLEEYNNNLLSKLRAFNSDENENKFIKDWIPEKNIINSLLNLIQSINKCGDDNIEIIIEEKRIKKYLNSFKKKISKFSNFQIDKKKKIIIRIKNIKDSLLKKTILSLQLNKKIKKKSVKKKIFFTSIKKNKIKILYYKKIKNKNIENFNKKSSFNFCSKFNGYKLFLDIKNKKIRNAFFAKGKNKIENYFLFNFCKIIKDNEIQEAFEHGVIKLANSLEPKNLNSKINGIVMPYLKKNIFNICDELIKIIWNKFSINIPTEKNINNLSIPEYWNCLEEEEKLNIISKNINKFEDLNNLKKTFSLKELNKNGLFTTILFYNNSSNQNKNISNLLLKLEKFLRNQLNVKIEIFYDIQIDQNKLRANNLLNK
jgi:hypothetical protein